MNLFGRKKAPETALQRPTAPTGGAVQQVNAQIEKNRQILQDVEKRCVVGATRRCPSLPPSLPPSLLPAVLPPFLPGPYPPPLRRAA